MARHHTIDSVTDFDARIELIQDFFPLFLPMTEAHLFRIHLQKEQTLVTDCLYHVVWEMKEEIIKQVVTIL